MSRKLLWFRNQICETSVENIEVDSDENDEDGNLIENELLSAESGTKKITINKTKPFYTNEEIHELIRM